METHLRYFENLKKTADENIRMLDDWPGTITLRQTIDELLDMGIVKNKMPDTMREYVAAQKALEDASRTREATLGRFRTLLEAQLGSTHQQMQMFNQRMEQTVRVSGGLILVATALALLLAWVFNHYFIRSRLVKRFTLLNQAVVQIGLGGTETTIPVYGNDELGRIAGLLRHTLGQLNVQKQQLEQEITDRKQDRSRSACHPGRTDSDSEAGGSRANDDHAGPRDQSAAKCAVDVSVYSPQGH